MTYEDRVAVVAKELPGWIRTDGPRWVATFRAPDKEADDALYATLTKITVYDHGQETHDVVRTAKKGHQLYMERCPVERHWNQERIDDLVRELLPGWEELAGLNRGCFVPPDGQVASSNWCEVTDESTCAVTSPVLQVTMTREIQNAKGISERFGVG